MKIFFNLIVGIFVLSLISFCSKAHAALPSNKISQEESVVNNIDLNDYISVGYRISKCIEPKVQCRFSVEDEGARIYFPDTWAIEWTTGSDFEGNAKLIGLKPEKFLEAKKYATENFDKTFWAWNNIYSLSEARNIIKIFFPDDHDIELVGFGLHKSNLEQFIKLEGVLEDSVADHNPGGKGTPPHALPHRLNESLVKNSQPLSSDKVEVLGHEICRLHYEDFLSEHYDATKELAESEGIKYNKFGLIDSYTNADLIADMRSDQPTGSSLVLPDGKMEEIKGNRWPLLIVRYGLDDK